MARSFAEVIAQRTDARVERRPEVVDAIVEDRQIMHPATGEIYDVAALSHEHLAEALVVLRQREVMLKQWRLVAEEELVRRNGDRDHPQIVGAWEVAVTRNWTRSWDADELEDAVTRLVNKRILPAGAVAGLIKVERKVDGRLAVALLNRVGGEEKKQLADAFAWVEKGRPKVTVTEIPDLANALPEGHESRNRS